MKSICAVFENWYLGDGTYPPLRSGMKVNLSFYISLLDKPLLIQSPKKFTQNKLSEYSFSGEIIRKYDNLIIVDAGTFKFYVELNQDDFSGIETGMYMAGKGNLTVDYYAWVENLKDYQNPPDIFYNLLVDKIISVKIPDKFINKNENSISRPTSLSTADYTEKDMTELEDMRADKNDMGFYLLHLKPVNENIQRTFLS